MNETIDPRDRRRGAGRADVKIGIFGYGLRSGIGQMNADLHDLAPWVHRWLVTPHRRRGIDPIVADRPRAHTVNGDARDAYRELLGEVDGVLFIERPYFQSFDPAAEARAAGRVVACIPMTEWLSPDAHWLESVDLMWAPTRRAQRDLAAAARYRIARSGPERTPWAGRIVGGRWGVDLERFRFRLRKRCETFLFANGFGGVQGRKGAEIVAAAARRAPALRVLVLSQTEHLPPMPPNVEVRVGNLERAAQLYEEGDVLLAPSAWEGLGLPLYEAQACGLPVLTTAAAPMNECGSELVPIRRVGFTETFRWIRRYEMDPDALAAAMRRLSNRSIELRSEAARERMEARHDLRVVFAELGAALETLVCQRRAGAA